jgi:predicted amidohydrolase
VSTFRIALANLRFPATPEESITLAEQAIAQASIEQAGLICFPECFVPGYRGLGKSVPPPDPAFLERISGVTAGLAEIVNQQLFRRASPRNGARRDNPRF